MPFTKRERTIIHREAERIKKFLQTDDGKDWMREEDQIHDEWVQKKYGNRGTQSSDIGGAPVQKTSNDQAEPQLRAHHEQPTDYEEKTVSSDGSSESTAGSADLGTDKMTGFTQGSESIAVGGSTARANYHEEEVSWGMDMISGNFEDVDCYTNNDFYEEESSVQNDSSISGMSGLLRRSMTKDQGEEPSEIATADEDKDEIKDCVSKGQSWMTIEDWLQDVKDLDDWEEESWEDADLE